MSETELVERVERLKRRRRRLTQAAGLGLISVALPVLMGQSACPAGHPKQASVPTQKAVQPYQRFVRIASAASMTLNWALDTKTGQVCRTWDWHMQGDKPRKNGEADITLATPTCFSLYREYPDSK